MNGEWIWILLALFGIFRLLMLAGKKKAQGDQGAAPPSSAPGPREEVDELKIFIDSLAARVGAEPRSRPPSPPRGWQSAFQPTPPPRPAPRPRSPDRPRPCAPRPESASAAPLRPLAPPPVERMVRPASGFLSFPAHPVVQGIIFSEILGPPRGLGGGARLPSDFDNL